MCGPICFLRCLEKFVFGDLSHIALKFYETEDGLGSNEKISSRKVSLSCRCVSGVSLRKT